ncbi:MAG: ABC transporter substrate-binding protein [Bacillus sp. (in: firmicutes)]
MNSQYIYYFLLLRKAYQSYENNVNIRITMNELVQILYCTQRNVKLILNKLMEEELIEFKSGKGRGNHSTIVFLENLEHRLQLQTQVLLDKNEIKKALELVKEFGEGTNLESFVIEWVSTYFGYKHVNVKDNDEIEILRFPIYRPITNVDPVHIFFDLDAHLVMQVFNTLVEYDFINRRFRQSLAHDWECTPDQKNWVFYLRKGVRFHNGRELIAEDVKQAISRLWQSPHKWLVNDIVEINVLSKYSILFRLREPNTLFLHFVSFAPMAIVDTSTSALGIVPYPIGTGPFKLESIDADHCVLAVFDSYFEARAHLDKVEIIRMPQDLRDDMKNFKKLIFDTGENKWTHNSWDDRESTFSGTNILTMNLAKKGPLQSLDLRRYIASYIDRRKLADLGKPRLGIANGFMLSEETVPELENTLPSISNLPLIGYKGEPLTLVTYSRHEQDAYCVQQNLKERGITVLVKIVEWNEIQSDSMLNEADMILFEATPYGNFITLFELFLFERGFVYPFLTSELRGEIDEWISKIKQEANLSLRINKYLELERLLVNQGVLTFLVHKQVEVFYEPSLEGVSFNSRMWIDFKKLWFKHSRIDQFQEQ